MKTYSVKRDDIKRERHVIDASDRILGRLATEIATLLMGKHKPMFSRSADVGDFVVVINAEKIQVTGKKAHLKEYHWHSNYPGGFKTSRYEEVFEKHPNRVLEYAIDGMLPHNHLHDKVMNRLKVYAGPTIPGAKPRKAPAVKETI
jgi:large subunit ribosomal protein L13